MVDSGRFASQKSSLGSNWETIRSVRKHKTESPTQRYIRASVGASALPKQLCGFEVRVIARQTDVSQTGLIEVPKFVARVTSPAPQSD
jgi:hypothetical protein